MDIKPSTFSPSEGTSAPQRNKDVGNKIDLFSIGVLNSVSAHIAVLDMGGDIIAINDAWKQFAKENDADQHLLQPGSNYFHACLKASENDNLHEARHAVEGIEKVLREELTEFELEYPCHSQNQKRWFLMRVTPMQFSGPKAVVSHINITDKKLAEKRLKDREKELSALHIISQSVNSSLSIEAVTQAILDQITSVIEPDKALLFLKEDDRLLLKGAKPDHSRDQTPMAHIHRVGHCLCGLSVSEKRSIFSKNIHADNRCTWEECKKAGFTAFAAIPLMSRNDIIGTLGIASKTPRDFEAHQRFLESIAKDVAICLENALLYEQVRVYAEDLEAQLAERKKMEKMLRQTQKMEAIGKLAGGIAHDFNNILSPIIGYTELIIGDLTRGTPMHDNLSEVLNAGHRAKHLVQQILTFTRQTEEQFCPIDMSGPVMEAMALLRSTVPSTIELIENIPPQLSPILGDATQIHQIILNLGTNAAQAMEVQGGILEVTLEQVYWDSKYIVDYKVLPKGNYIKLTVSDTGNGMAPEILESIFDPYFTTKAKGKGTGLGLAVVQGIIKSHHGEINVYSEPDQGSTFTIYFPAIQTAPESQPDDPGTIPTGTESVLYVDDEIAIANLGKQSLEQLGYSVTSMTRSPEAWRVFKNNPQGFDAVITDMTMPDLRGDQLAAQIHRMRPNMPIVICTGFSQHITKGISKELEITVLLMKPFSQRDLAIALRKAIDGTGTQ